METQVQVRIDSEDGPRGRVYLSDLIGGLMGLGHSDEDYAEEGKKIEHRLTSGDWWNGYQLGLALDWLRQCLAAARQEADVDYWLDTGLRASMAKNWAEMRAGHVCRLEEALAFVEPFYEHVTFGTTVLNSIEQRFRAQDLMPEAS